ncbi:MAG: tetratricopeptide repeat protein [Rhodoferax sp.]|nr:tetratricopeptide repeat protein [Rhodoferax sp.]
MKPPRAKHQVPPRPADDAGDLWVRQGREYWQQGALAQAVDCAQKALQHGASPLDAYGLLGDSLLGLRQFEPALHAYESALALAPTNIYLRFLCGEALFHLERYADVIACLTDLDPCNNQGLAVERAMTLGRAQQKLGMTEQAELHLLKAYMLQPGNEDAVCNLAGLYEESGRHALALPFLEPAVRQHPTSVRLHYNLGSDLSECGQTARSIDVLSRTLELAPHHIKAHQNLALALLLHGELKTGWPHYAWRFNRHAAEGGQADWIPQTPQLPNDLSGLMVRILGEQGIGDELFFMRYLPALRARGARVLYRLCNAKLQGLLPYLESTDLIDSLDTGDTTADVSLLAGDLPFALGEPQIHRYPAPLKIHADAAQVHNWKTRFPLLRRDRMRLGITWRAGTAPALQLSDQHRWLSKTMPLDALLDVLAPLPVDLVVLQRNPRAEELQTIEQRVGAERLLDASRHDNDLVELVALLSQLDGLVGVSNTNVHLAAGLGKSIDTLVPVPYEFRWHAQGLSSPWFPAAAVYRQQLNGDWRPAMTQLQTQLLCRYNTPP